jgi:glycosyltransferase involved in cell wall biosynthesis
MSLPRCALLIPHYNNMPGLMRSLASIGALEVLDVFIIDDGSAIYLDEAQVRQAFQAKGSVYFIYLAHNVGIAQALNIGVTKTRHYEYIARLDCGDVCHADRFKQQMAFLDDYPHIALLGTAAAFVDQQNKIQYTLYLPTQPSAIARKMHDNCAFIHPTVMWRSQMAGHLNYPVNYPMAEDFAFFWLFVKQFATANLPAVLVSVEINPQGLSISRRQTQLHSRLRLQWRYFNSTYYACLGVIKTGLLMALPYRVILWIKRRWR